jgi:hypothetical protein
LLFALTHSVARKLRERRRSEIRMNPGMKRGTFTIFAVGFSLCVCAGVWAGGELGEARDHTHDGLSIFGFVKDPAGRAIRDAKVTADIKGLGSVIARTDATGVYRLPGFGKGITQSQVSISCSKDGYKQTRTLNRTSPAKKPVTAIEIECTMQPTGGK